MHPSRVRIWIQGWVTPNSCPPLCTNLSPSEVEPEPMERLRCQPRLHYCSDMVHVGHCPLTLTEAELRQLPSATRWGCPCQLHAGGLPALHPTSGYREGSCSLPEPSGSFLSCPAHSLPSYPPSLQSDIWKHLKFPNKSFCSLPLPLTM